MWPGVLNTFNLYLPNSTKSFSSTWISASAPLHAEIIDLHPDICFNLPEPVIWSACMCVFTEKRNGSRSTYAFNRRNNFFLFATSSVNVYLFIFYILLFLFWLLIVTHKFDKINIYCASMSQTLRYFQIKLKIIESSIQNVFFFLTLISINCILIDLTVSDTNQNI